MKLQDILTKYNYHNIIHEEDNTIVIENDYSIGIILFIDHANNQYNATFSDEYEFSQLAKIKSKNYNEFLKLLDTKLELNNSVWITRHI